MSAPYTGGFDPSGPQFAVDGDFYSCDPCGPPKISYPFKGDSIFSNRDIVIFNESEQYYATVPLGQFPNLQPWSANQRAFIIEQDFMVAMEAYLPLPMNNPYHNYWAIGWLGQLTNGYPLPDLSQAIFVEEDPLEDMGQGIVKVRRRFATIPQTRNEVEQFTYVFPGLINSRKAFDWTVPSRIQYDYYVFDDYGILNLPVWPAGPVLNASTGIYPTAYAAQVPFILEQQFYYAPVVGAVDAAFFLENPVTLTDDISDDVPATIPSATDWNNWLIGDDTSNDLPPEIVAEFSTLRRWMGNIWERRTRFIQVQ